MSREFKAIIWREDDIYVAQCLDIDIASQGDTEKEALISLKEAIELHFVPPIATALPKLASITVDIDI